MYLPTNLLIRSIDRDLYSNTQSTSNFTLRLPSDIRNAKKMCLVNCMLPYTFYNIMQNNNDTFLIDGNMITLSPGNYNSNTSSISWRYIFFIFSFIQFIDI